MRRKSNNQVKIEREEATLKVILQELPENPIPWLAVVRIIAPIVARLAVRYALKRAKRGLSEEKVSAIAGSVSELISTITGGLGTPKP